MSNDRGVSWAIVNTGLPNYGVMAADASLGGRLWVGTCCNQPVGLSHSIDGGATWTPVPGFVNITDVDAANDRIAVPGRRRHGATARAKFTLRHGLRLRSLIQNNPPREMRGQEDERTRTPFAERECAYELERWFPPSAGGGHPPSQPERNRWLTVSEAVGLAPHRRPRPTMTNQPLKTMVLKRVIHAGGQSLPANQGTRNRSGPTALSSCPHQHPASPKFVKHPGL